MQPTTIEPHFAFDRILRGFGVMGEMLAAQCRKEKWDRNRQVQVTRGLLDACIAEGQDKHTVAMLELLQRAHTDETNGNERVEASNLFRRDLEEIFWGLPCSTTGPGGGTQPFLPLTKLHIIRQLICEWRATALPESVYAFRRLIAMGWPLQKDYRQRPEESDVEMKGRGRFVCEEEHRGICDIIRNHMEDFGSYEERKAGPDAVFGLWLRYSFIPENIRNLLIMARAKMGGSKLVARDLRNATILDGIPESGLNLVAATTERMREAVVAGERVTCLALAAFKQSYNVGEHYYLERYFADAKPCTFVDMDTVKFRFGPYGKAEDLLIAAAAAIHHVHADSILGAFNVVLEVADHQKGDTAKPTLTKFWQRAR